MNKIFIDCGAHKATSVKNFKENYPDGDKYKIFSFEANSEFRKCFDEYPDTKLEIALVWTMDGEQVFYNANNESSSVYKDKSRGGAKQIINSIDLDRWVKENLNKDDHIVLKLDIEGAEYEVLEHMIKNGSIEYVDKLFIEWHCAKVKEITPSRHIDLLEKLADLRLAPYSWSHTNTDFNKLELSERNIARNNNDKAGLEKHRQRYERICKTFKEIDKHA